MSEAAAVANTGPQGRAIMWVAIYAPERGRPFLVANLGREPLRLQNLYTDLLDGAYRRRAFLQQRELDQSRLLEELGQAGLLFAFWDGSRDYQQHDAMRLLVSEAERQHKLHVVLLPPHPADSPSWASAERVHALDDGPLSFLDLVMGALKASPERRGQRAMPPLRRPEPLSVGALGVLHAAARVASNRRGAPAELPEEASDSPPFTVEEAEVIEPESFDFGSDDFVRATPSDIYRPSRFPAPSSYPSPASAEPAAAPSPDGPGTASPPSYPSHASRIRTPMRLRTPMRFPETVDVSAFGPPEIERGGEAFVQIFLHRPDDAGKAAALAKAADREAEQKAVSTLLVDIATGQHLVIQLEVPGASVDEPVQEIVWQGTPESRGFTVTAPKDTAKTAFTVSAIVRIDGKLEGSVRFRLPVVDAHARKEPEIRGSDAGPFQRIFASYATPDRIRVLEDVQVLTLARHEVFVDLVSLNPGDKLSKDILKKIAECDLFLLYWSSHALKSEWVRQETDFALRQHETSDAPDILPRLLEGPPVPLPPKEWGWSDINFNDKLRWLMLAEETLRKQAGAPATGGGPPPAS